MQIISQTDLALVNAYRKITLTIYLDGKKLDAGIGSCEYQTSCGNTEEFSFGNACAAGATLPIDGAYPNLKGQRISIKWSVSDTEYPLLAGQVENCVVNAGRTTLEIWDDMYYGGSGAFVSPSRMLTDCAAADAFQAVADAMGVEPEPETLEILSGITIIGGLSDLPEEISISAVAGHIAGLVGGNAFMTRDGLLAIRGYSATGWASEVYSGGASAENTDYSVTGVTFQREQEITVTNTDGRASPETQTLEFGAGDGTLMISNPLADQDAADRAYNALESVVIRPGSYRMPGGIQLEPGDMITAITMDGSYAVAVVQLAMTLDGGCQATVSCSGEPPSCGAVGQIHEALKALNYALIRVKKLIASDISASRITTGILQSENGETFYLDLVNGILKGNFEELHIVGKTVDEIARDNAADAVNNQTQQDIFNKLTKNGELPGLFMKDGQLFINASYLATGVIRSEDGRVKIDLTNGLIDATGNFRTSEEIVEGYTQMSEMSPEGVAVRDADGNYSKLGRGYSEVNDAGGYFAARAPDGRWQGAGGVEFYAFGVGSVAYGIMPYQEIIGDEINPDPKAYVDIYNDVDGTALNVLLQSGKVKISGLTAPENDSDAVNKAYVDNLFAQLKGS